MCAWCTIRLWLEYSGYTMQCNPKRYQGLQLLYVLLPSLHTILCGVNEKQIVHL